MLLTQLLVATQSALVVQLVLQVGVAVSQRYGLQAVLVTVLQTPVPSHVRCGVCVEPVQVAAAHCVPFTQNRQAPAPSHIPSVPHVVDVVVEHCVAGVGAVPPGTLLHVPTLPAIAHDLQVPVHALLQQKPCAQKPESHSPAVVHAVPIGFSVQMVALQMLGDTQSVLAEQLVRQALAVESQVYFPHGSGVAAPQVPAPSHARADSAVVVLMHAGPAHCVPLAYLWHAPAPSHMPSLPQVDAAAIGHWDATSGGDPAGIGEQVPTLPVSEHDVHVPVHALLQQTLLTQWPDAQSASSPDEQVPPTGILPQLMAVQVLPVVQSAAVVVHVVLHAVVAHWYGAHELVVAARHAPTPSHDRGADSVDPVQLAAPQLVPAAYLRHAPAPSHLPSVPHDVPPMSVHCVAGDGAVPAATGTHVPAAQVMQVAAQPVLQQMPPSQ
jgi:hypothetical protein